MPETPGSSLPPERRKEHFDAFYLQFANTLKQHAIGRTAQELVACRLTQVHHWPIAQSLSIHQCLVPLCLPEDWKAFLLTLAATDIDYIRSWEDEHGFPTESPVSCSVNH